MTANIEQILVTFRSGQWNIYIQRGQNALHNINNDLARLQMQF